MEVCERSRTVVARDILPAMYISVSRTMVCERSHTPCVTRSTSRYHWNDEMFPRSRTRLGLYMSPGPPTDSCAGTSAFGCKSAWSPSASSSLAAWRRGRVGGRAQHGSGSQPRRTQSHALSRSLARALSLSHTRARALSLSLAHTHTYTCDGVN